MASDVVTNIRQLGVCSLTLFLMLMLCCPVTLFPRGGRDNSTAVNVSERTTTGVIRTTPVEISNKSRPQEGSPVSQTDIKKLYDAVFRFLRPWFEQTETSSSKSDANRTADEDFDDFEDPDPIEDEDNTFLRYIRDVSESDGIPLLRFVRSTTERRGRTLVDSAVNLFSPYARKVDSGSGTNNGDWFRLLVRHTRDIIEGNCTIPDAIISLVGNVCKNQTLVRQIRESVEGRQNLFQGYYDFAINEYSYKFWAVYMLGATALLLYSAVAAIYYSKFNTSAVDYELYDDFARANNNQRQTMKANPIGIVGSLISVQTFQRIMEALSSKKYT